MRHCSRENVDVYEIYGKNLATCLIGVAEQIDNLPDALWYSVHTERDPELTWTVTLYVHN